MPGWPRVARSSLPGRAPPTFWSVSLSARPMAALARVPCPKTLPPALMPRRPAIGPLTMMSGEQGWVVVCTACKLKDGSATASTAASTTGRCSGSAPAITALAAMASTVARPSLGTSTATISSGFRRQPASIAATRSRVGGMAGSPSPQPRSISHAWKRSRSSGASTSPVAALAACEAAAASEVSARSTLSTIGPAFAATAAAGMPPIG